jgi:translocation and assembly module TamB
MRSGPGRSVPAADVDAVAKLAGTMAQLDIHLTAGASRLNIVGAAPLSPSGALNLHTTGNLDLAVLNPILAANGRRASGKLAVNVTVGGTIAAPAISGTAQLSNGDVQDYTVGAHLTDITAQLEGAGGTLRLQANAKAGPGTLSASGSIGVLSPGIPLDLTLTARNAQPLASDLITALIDADLTLRGEAAGQLAAGGTLHVRRAEIRVPEKLPGSLATIPVRVAGVPPPPPPPPGPDVTLNLTLEAPGQIFVRGRGLDVELGGTIHLKGTAANPQPDGGFELRRGTLSIAGQTLTFTQGTISFNGAGLVDPALDLIISTISNNVTATLTVGGTARKPTITLASVPDLPQDEVLAELLFKRRVSSLGPFELAEIASALASLTGAPSIDNPLASIRQGLGLDRLGVGTGASGAPTLEAGRYLAPGIYLGAKQAVSGGGSQATVQIDIAKGLKLEATTGAGSSNSATGAGGNSNGSSVGVTYQFDY